MKADLGQDLRHRQSQTTRLMAATCISPVSLEMPGIAPAAAREQDTDVRLWTAPAVGAVKIASSKAADAVVEDL